MPKIILSLGLLLPFTGVIYADELPEDSKDLVEKLEAFKTSEEKKLEAMLLNKQQAVVKILTQHLERETKSGNLDGAVAIRKRIASLNGQSKIEDPNQSQENEEPLREKRIPEDAVERSGHFYKVFEAPPKSWLQAQSKCEAMGGHLAIINTSSELRFLARLASEYSLVWLGASGNYEDGWKWVDGTDFKDGPELKKGDQRGVLLSSSRINYDFHAVKGHFCSGFVCEWSD